MVTMRWGSRSRKLILLLSIGCGLVQAAVVRAVTVGAGNAAGSPGQTVTIPIALDNHDGEPEPRAERCNPSPDLLVLQPNVRAP